MAMKTAKQMEAVRRRRNRPVATTPIACEIVKQKFVELLATGDHPGKAAKKLEVSRGAFYKWRKEDDKFAAAWDDAVETSLDNLESALYQDGLTNLNENARYLLQRRRFDRLNVQQPAQMIVNITLQEHVRRIVDVGLPQPQIEKDLDILDVAADTP